MAKKKSQHGGPRPNSGRPTLAPGEGSILVGANLPISLVERLDAYAAQHECTRAQAIREAVGLLLTGK